MQVIYMIKLCCQEYINIIINIYKC